MPNAEHKTMPDVPAVASSEGGDATTAPSLPEDLAKWCPSEQQIQTTFEIARERFGPAAAAAWLRGWFNVFRDLMSNKGYKGTDRLKALEAIAKTFGTPKLFPAGSIKRACYLRRQIEEIRDETGVDIRPMVRVLEALSERDSHEEETS